LPLVKIPIVKKGCSHLVYKGFFRYVRERILAQFLVYLGVCRWSALTMFYIFTQRLFMNEAEYLDQEDQEKAVEIRIEDVIYRSDESPAVVLAIKRTCSLSGECKVGHVTLGQETTLRLYLET
jgi:hypothetical protein